jgi:hypothetical protein
MSELEAVEFILKEGPVVIQGQGGAKIDASHRLWGGISAKEFFPPGAETGAFYVITLTKNVTQAEQVRAAEVEISKALFKIASAWVFSGGSHMEVETREVISSPRVISNVDAVLQRLLGKANLTQVSVNFGMPIECIATYSQAPLTLATEIARLMQVDFFVSRLIGYYHQAWTEQTTSSWAPTLYKVRESLHKRYRGEAKARRALGIPYQQWKRFGTLLNNNDLRHAEICGIAPSISREDIEWLYKMARCWTATFLRAKGVNAIG